MALIKCPDCGRDISDQAPACPHCGRPAAAGTPVAPTAAPSPEKAKTSAAAWGCLAIIVLVFVIVVIGSSGSEGGSNSSSSTSSSVDLKAAVRFTGLQFAITNNDSFDWQNCELEINPRTFSSGFKYNAGSLRAGREYSVGALQFANGEGKRFNPLEFKPTSVTISCNTPRGRGFYYGAWK